MADSNFIVPFILKAEGGYVNDKNDSGGETMKGVTYTVWKVFFGDTHDRFMKMAQEDWSLIFKTNYWNKILGDQINSNKIASAIVDWVYNSGTFYPEKNIEEIMNTAFGQHLTVDGVFGPKVIASLNTGDQDTEFQAIIDRHRKFINDLVVAKPSQIIYQKGWLNRLQNLVSFVNGTN